MAILTPKWIRKIKTCNLYLCFFVLGSCIAIPGPTLVDLMHITETDFKSISLIYTARSVGTLCGSLIGGIFLDMTNKKHFILTFFNLAISVSMLAIPWSRQILTLAAWMAVSGFSLGVLVTGGNVCCLELWGKDNGPFYQALHLVFGVGGFTAPLIAAPFLEHYRISSELNNTTAIYMNLTMFLEGRFPNASFVPSIPKVTYAYTSIGGFSFIVTILFFITCFIPIIEEIGEKKETSHLTKNSFSFVFILVLFTCILIMMSMGTEIAYPQMLTTYAVKGNLHLRTVIGSYMTSAYWAAFTVSRLGTIFLVIKFSDKTLLMFNLVVIYTGSLILVLLSVHYEWALWLASVLLGAGISFFVPFSISWVEKYITLTNKISSLFSVAAAVGEMLIPYIIGHFFNEYPEVFTFVNLVSCVIVVIVSLIMYLMLRNRPDKYTFREGNVNASYVSEIVNVSYVSNDL